MKIGRWIAIACVVAALAPSIAAGPSQAAVCEEVRFIGVRGSGQTVSDADGYGVQVDMARRRYVEVLDRLRPGIARSEIPLDYTAAGVDVIGRYGHSAAGLSRGVSEFLASIADGIAKVSAEMRRVVAGCPAPLLVLVGYSQGAMVIHWALNQVSNESSILERVASVQLLSDPLRLGSSPTNIGTASTGTNGIATSFRIGPNRDVPAAVRQHTASWCEATDLVCDWGATTAAFFESGVPERIHTGTYQGTPAFVAGFVAARHANNALSRQPDPVPAPPVGVGRPDPVGHEGTVLPPRPVQSGRIAAGRYHTCALISDGTARCWGRNYYGQLGDGTQTYRSTPVAVSGLSDAIQITAGAWHTCALISDGTARCWGWNYYRQLGDGTQTDRSTPVAVSGLSDAIQITAGGRHTCALISDGTARCWGYNGYGQLGDGTQNQRSTPVAVHNFP